MVTAEPGSPPEFTRERRTCQLQNLRRQVLQDRGRIDRRLRPYAHIVLRPLFQVTVYTSYGELQVEVLYTTDELLSDCTPQFRG